MRYEKISTQFFVKNRKKLIKNIPPKSLVIISSNDEMPRTGDQNFIFRQNSDLFYFSGLDQEKTTVFLLVGEDKNQIREMAFVTESNEHSITWIGHKYSKTEVKEVSGIQEIYWENQLDGILQQLFVNVENVFLNIDEQAYFSSEIKNCSQRLAFSLKEKYPLHNFKRLFPISSKLRLIKEKEEIELMKKAHLIMKDAFLRVLKNIKPEMKEYEIEAELSYEMSRQGASGHSFSPIVASGKNACVLHYIKNDDTCKNGDLLLIDFGAEYANYAGDCSRTIPVNGKFSPRQRECYQALLDVQKEAEKLFVVGNTISKVNEEVGKMMEKIHVELSLYSAEELENQKKENPQSPLYKKYYMHGTSHFIGLDAHDVGDRETVFENGMMLTNEPGLYIKEENIGIRIENVLLINDNEPINITGDIPREVEEIEKFMKK